MKGVSVCVYEGCVSLCVLMVFVFVCVKSVCVCVYEGCVCLCV